MSYAFYETETESSEPDTESSGESSGESSDESSGEEPPHPAVAFLWSKQKDAAFDEFLHLEITRAVSSLTKGGFDALEAIIGTFGACECLANSLRFSDGMRVIDSIPLGRREWEQILVEAFCNDRVPVVKLAWTKADPSEQFARDCFMRACENHSFKSLEFLIPRVDVAALNSAAIRCVLQDFLRVTRDMAMRIRFEKTCIVLVRNKVVSPRVFGDLYGYFVAHTTTLEFYELAVRIYHKLNEQIEAQLAAQAAHRRRPQWASEPVYNRVRHLQLIASQSCMLVLAHAIKRGRTVGHPCGPMAQLPSDLVKMVRDWLVGR